MGTNYYLETECCVSCKRAGERIHIGKSSSGWCFSLHVNEEYTNLADWQAAWSLPGTRIVDEYERGVTPDEMLSIITERVGRDRPKEDQWYAGNHGQPGPHGLVRHTIDRFCVGHGAGTYDLLRGDFS